jgi:hypothetical protein
VISKHISIAAALSVAAALGATTAQAASAKSFDGVRAAGTCSDTSTSKLKVKHDAGRLQVEFEVDQNRSAVPWKVEVRKDGKLVFRGTRLTAGPSGSFSLERRVAGARGVIKARATRNGETCTAITTARAASANALVNTNPAAAATVAVSDDAPGHDAADDKGQLVGDDGAAHDAVDDNGGHHGLDD